MEEKVAAVDWNGSELPETDLFVKPSHGRDDRNATRWIYLGSGKYRRNDGEILSGTQLLERLRLESRQKAFLIQPRLLNHEDIADLANGTLAAVRVMNCRNDGASLK